MGKYCNSCKKTKGVDAFAIRSDRPNGRQSKCRQCSSEYRKNNLQYYKDYAVKWRKENSKEINSYHVKYNATRDDGLYYKWTFMLKRLNSEEDSYSYKSRGIKNEWSSYSEFKKDMYESFLDHLKKYGIKDTTLDRINNDGNYSKENCRWATIVEQANNKRPYRNLGNWGKRKGRTFKINLTIK